jgi:hypothetical protein
MTFSSGFDFPSSPVACATGSSPAEAGEVVQHCAKAKGSVQPQDTFVLRAVIPAYSAACFLPRRSTSFKNCPV